MGENPGTERRADFKMLLRAPKTRGLGLWMLDGLLGDLTSLPSGDCVPSPCHNGGTCLEEEEGVRCLCLPGYGGDLCDVGECAERQGWGVGADLVPGPAPTTRCLPWTREGGRQGPCLESPV